MRLVERHVIDKNHQHWVEIDDLSFKAKNLYNLANYHCRQRFFAEHKAWGLNALYHLTKDSDAYRALPTKVSKQIVKRVVKCWTGYFAAIREYRLAPDKFLSEPKIPGYKDKTDGRYVVPYPGKESIYKAELAKGIVHLSMSEIRIPTAVRSVVEVRLVPRCNCYVMEVVYDQPEKPALGGSFIAGMDLGLNNLVALSSNRPGFVPLLVTGTPLKSVNQFYNKRKAQLQSQLGSKRQNSHRLIRWTQSRNQYIDNYLHQTSRLVVNYLKTWEVGTLVIGKNDRWKQSINIGKRNNQNFVQIPHARLIEMITYKCQLEGIVVILNEESYSSKASALDFDPVPSYGAEAPKFSGRRVKRGLYKTASGKLINADINGSLNIVRKVFPNAFTAEGIVSAAVAPLKVLPS
jgi:putative transposase